MADSFVSKENIKLKTYQNIEDLFQAQKNHSPDLKSEPIQRRKDRLRRLEKWILSNLSEIHTATYQDMHKPRIESDITEAYVVLAEIRHALRNIRSWTRPHFVRTPLALMPAEGWIRYVPKGVCLIIAPWNFPFNLAVSPLVSALAAGNSAIIKPSELAPATSRLINTMVRDLFQPEEVMVVEGAVEVAKELLKLPFNHVFFTGSPEVGRKILLATAENLTSVTLELGGKSPVVITPSANIKDAVDKIVVGKFFNSGQTCIAPDYCLVHESIKEKFLSELQESLLKHYGNAEKGGAKHNPDYSRIINGAHYERLKGMLDDAIEKGANVISGGQCEEEDLYIEPTIIRNISHDMLVMQKEIFGPILPVTGYEKTEQVIDLIIGMPSPLVLYVFSKDKHLVDDLSTFTDSGTVSWNDVAFYFLHTGLPFGGINQSGNGRAHGFSGFKTFSNERSFFHQRDGWIPGKLLFPPFTDFSNWISRIIVRYL